jgi:ATP-dependent Clp protease adapter protein ClpS
MISTMKFLLSVLPLFLCSSLFGTCIAFHSQQLHVPVQQQQRHASTTHNRLNTALAAGPATIEREKTVRTTGPAVLDRPAEKKVNDRSSSVVKEREHVGGEEWEVRIYNDGLNTREHVARSLVQITGITEMTAYQTMMTAHQNGIACVGVFCFEIAETYNEGLHKQGIVSDIVPVDEEQ